MQNRTKITGICIVWILIILSSGCVKRQLVQKESLKTTMVEEKHQKEKKQEKKKQKEEKKEEKKEEEEEGAKEKESKKKLLVHVCGEVLNPGVYEIEEGGRVWEAVRLAGGFTQEADPDYLNQATKVTDGEQLYIPGKEETKERERVSESRQEGGEGPSASGVVDLNKASKEELMSLSGIGEAKAEAILAYRQERGKFEKVEEIKEVSGIGEGVFRKIKEKIRVN